MLLSRLFRRSKIRPVRRPLAHRRLLVEALEGRQLLAIFTVTSANDSGPGSFRQALLSSNASTASATNTINFQVGGGVQTIALESALPAVTHAVTINGFTQPGTGTAPRIVLDGTNAGASSAGLTLSKSNSTIEGLAIDNFAEYGISVVGSANTIADNYIGLTPAGAVAANTHNAINLANARSNTITGNVVSGNHGNGIEIYASFNNVVTGNLVGTNPAGTAPLPNDGNAVKIEWGSAGNIIGGTAPGASNVLSGNDDCGVRITTGSSSNLVEGNSIGTNAAGTAALGNALDGVPIDYGSDANVIGGTAAGARNLISGNLGQGIEFDDGANGNFVEGNFVGTNAAGTADLGNAGDGVMIVNGSAGNVIGGTATGAGNVISGNQGRGVHLINGANGDFVEGNAIGTNAAGNAALGNADEGVEIEYGCVGDVIGGTASGAGNTVANNGNGGVALIEAGKGNLVEDNVISSNGFGQPTAGLGDGVYLMCSPGSTVSNNTIEFNRDWAINLDDSGSSVVTGNTFQGNGRGNIHS